MATPRNEYGLTAYQQTRYNKIAENMLGIQEILNSNEYISLNLQERISISNVLKIIEEDTLRIDRIRETIEQFSEFINKENEIQISVAEADKLYRDCNSIKNSGLIYKAEYILAHSKKLEKLEKIRKEKENTPDFKSEVVKDMIALENEFPSVKFNIRSGHVYCTTEDIILTDEHGIKVNLGKFKLSYKTSMRHIDIKAIALEPVWHQHSRNFHPHVEENGRICLGEANSILNGAHKRGDLYTIFMTLKNLLETYNPGSPYARLETWIGTPCDHCGRNGDAGNRIKCKICNDSICENCYTQLDYPRYRRRGINNYICETCMSEEKNRCPGINNTTCSQYINSKEHLYCGDCHEIALSSGLDVTPGENIVEAPNTNITAAVTIPSPAIIREPETGIQIEVANANLEPAGDTDPFNILRNTVQQLEQGILTENTSPVISNMVNNMVEDHPETTGIRHTCTSCNRPFEINETTILCNDCNLPICEDCSTSTICENCGEHICSGCRIPCSRCRIPVHIDCTSEDENRNMLCSTCQPQPTTEPNPIINLYDPQALTSPSSNTINVIANETIVEHTQQEPTIVEETDEENNGDSLPEWLEIPF